MKLRKGTNFVYADSFYVCTIEKCGKNELQWTDSMGYLIVANRADFEADIASGYVIIL